MKTIQITLTTEQYDKLLAAMQEAGFSNLESFIYSLMVQAKDC